MAKHRSLRGTLTSQIKGATFSVFGEADLPCVNANSSPNEIKEWKETAANRCHKKLFEPISPSDNKVTYMSRILEKVWVDPEKTSNTLTAFAISVTETLLNPKNDGIQINEETLKSSIRKNLVNLRFLYKKMLSS
jgi:hypothetical protein